MIRCLPGALAVYFLALSLASCEQGTDPVATARVEIAPAPSRLLVGETVQLRAVVQNSRGNILLDHPVAWSSRDPGVAVVDSTGVLTGRTEGETEIIATSEGRSDTLAVRVHTLVFRSVDAGLDHSCGVTAEGDAYCWGSNTAGQLGIGTADTASHFVPQAVAGGHRLAAVDAGGSISCGLAIDGAAYCWGSGSHGQLGDGSTSDRAAPVAVAGGITFAAVSAGAMHSCGLDRAGGAHCWGDNKYGQLGDGSRTNSTVPVRAAGEFTFRAISVGVFHTCALTDEGTAYCWGNGGWGQLGHGEASLTDCGLTSYCSLTPSPVVGGLTFASLEAGEIATCGLTVSGAAYCWGNNRFGQLGNGTVSLNDPTAAPSAVVGGLAFASVTVGGPHACALAPDGAAYCWGAIASTGSGEPPPTRLCSDGMYGYPCSPEPVAVPGAVPFRSVDAGVGHACGIAADGRAYCWGHNGRGQLGTGTAEQCVLLRPKPPHGYACSSTPVRVGGQA